MPSHVVVVNNKVDTWITMDCKAREIILAHRKIQTWYFCFKISLISNIAKQLVGVVGVGVLQIFHNPLYVWKFLASGTKAVNDKRKIRKAYMYESMKVQFWRWIQRSFQRWTPNSSPKWSLYSSPKLHFQTFVCMSFSWVKQ